MRLRSLRHFHKIDSKTTHRKNPISQIVFRCISNTYQTITIQTGATVSATFVCVGYVHTTWGMHVDGSRREIDHTRSYSASASMLRAQTSSVGLINIRSNLWQLLKPGGRYLHNLKLLLSRFYEKQLNILVTLYGNYIYLFKSIQY